MRQKLTLLTKTMLLLCALVAGSGSAWADEVIWEEDWSSGSANDQPSDITNTNATYSESSTSTKLYAEKLAGGESPELLVAKGTTSTFTATIDLGGHSGDLTFTFKTNGTNIALSTTTTGATVTGTMAKGSNSFTINVPSGIESLVLVFTSTTSNKNTRLDDLKLTGPSSSDPSSSVAFTTDEPTIDLKDGKTYTQTATAATGYSSTSGASVTYSIGATNTAGATLNASTGEVTVTQAGSVIVTATAAAVTGSWASSTASYTLTVTDTRDDANISWSSDAAVNIEQGATDGDYTLPTLLNPENLAVTYTITGTDGLAVEVDGTIMVDTDVLGSATVTATYSGDAYKPTSVSYIINVYEPVVFTEFYASFDDCTSTGGNNGVFTASGNGSIPSSYANTDGWTFKNASAADRCIKVGTSSGGYIITPELKLNPATDYVLLFKAAQWSTDGATLTLSSDDAVFGGNTSTTVDMPSAKWDGFYVELTNGQADTQVKFTPAKRMFFDEIRVMEKSTFEALSVSKTVETYGWATYIPDYNVTFAAGDAYLVTEASVAGGLTLEAVTSVPAKTPVLLKGAGSKTITVSNAANVSGPATNLLTISNGAALASGYPYVLAKNGDGACFKQWTGAASALENRVVLVLDEAVSTARSIFMLDDEATGIEAIRQSPLTIDQSVYNLNGQRVDSPQKGLYIVNGRKVMMK